MNHERGSLEIACAHVRRIALEAFEVFPEFAVALLLRAVVARILRVAVVHRRVRNQCLEWVLATEQVARKVTSEAAAARGHPFGVRSEERRVGKEGRQGRERDARTATTRRETAS